MNTLRTLRRATLERLRNRGFSSPGLLADLFMSHVLGIDRKTLYLRIEEPVPPEVEGPLREALGRFEAGEPLHYIIGSREFWSLTFRVTPAVLIPRPETEVLVEQALAWLQERCGPQGNACLRVLDLGTGSGAIAVSLAVSVPGLEVTAADISPEALEVAKHNAEQHGVLSRITWRLGDLFEAVHGDPPFDAIVSNPPYIPSEVLEALPPEIRDHEPRVALDGGSQGLSVVIRIFEGAQAHLRPGGILFVELSPEQAAPAVQRLRSLRGYGTPSLKKDYAGRERVLCATKSEGNPPWS